MLAAAVTGNLAAIPWKESFPDREIEYGALTIPAIPV